MTAIAQAQNTEVLLAHRDGLSWWTRDALLDEPTKQVWQWEPEEVAKFLPLVEGMEFFAPIFVDHHITGLRLLKMNEARLAQLGINSVGAREHLMTEIAILRKWGVSKHVHWYVTDDDHQPGNIIEGLIDGITELIRGIMEGLVGVLYEPAKAVRQDGSGGFYGGLGLGLTGLVFRPLGGACDFLRNVSDGIKNTPMCLDSEDEKEEYLKEKVDREVQEKRDRREAGKKERRPNTIDDDYPRNVFRGIQQGIGRFVIQWYLGFHVFMTAPCKSESVPKGVFKGVMSLVCRPTAGCIDLVQRIAEGVVNTPDAMFDACQVKDFRNREAIVGSDLWWERNADPGGAAAMGLGVQGAASNVGFTGGSKNINADTGPLATNTLQGLAENAGGDLVDLDAPIAMQKQLAEARVAAQGAGAQTVANPMAGQQVGAVGMGSIAHQGFAPQLDDPMAGQMPAAAAGGGFCSGCGTQLAPGAKFCASCGTPSGAGAGADMV